MNELIDINSKYNEYNIKYLYPILKSNVDIKVQKRKTPSTTLTEATQEESRKWWVYLIVKTTQVPFYLFV